MDERRVKMIIEGLRKKATTEEMLLALNENNHNQWSEEGFEAIKRVLRERKVNFKVFPEQNDISKVDEFNIKFSMWTGLKGIKSQCQYVGNGKIVLSQYGIKIFGKTYYSSDAPAYLDPRRSVLGLLLLRKKNDIIIPWEDIANMKQDQKKNKIGIEYINHGITKGPKFASVIFKSVSFDSIISAFEKRSRKINI